MKSFFRPRAGLLKQDRGAEVAEAAVILPVLFLLLFSIYWFGRGFNIYGTINHAAREGARAAAVPACGNCTSCTWLGSNLPCDVPVVTAVNNALVAAHLDPTLAVPFVPSQAPGGLPPASCGASPPGFCATSSSGTFTICRNVELNPNSAAPAPAV